MDTPVIKHKIHPILATAAVAVVLFCGVGSAALLGWLPSSSANGTVPGAAPMPGQLSSIPPSEQDRNGLQRTMPPAGQQLAYADGGTASGNQVQAESKPAPCSNCGVVESVRAIEHRPQGSGVGAAGGAILGGLLGNQVGSGHGRQLATVAGAVGGAVAGNQIESNMKTTHSWEIVVRMDDGHKRTLHQSSQPGWRAGDAVKVVKGQLRPMD